MTGISLYLSLFTSTFLSATLIPFSSELAFLYAIHQEQNFLLCLIVATTGNSLGGATNYFIGKFGNDLWKKRIGYKEKQNNFRKYIDKYGTYTAFFSWVPFIGDPLLLLLGMMRTPFYKVLVFMVLGKFLRYLTIGLFFI